MMKIYFILFVFIFVKTQKKAIVDQLITKIQAILVSSTTTSTSNEPGDENATSAAQQIKDTFDYFLLKLCSDRLSVRLAAMRIFRRFFPSSCPIEQQQIVQPQQQQQQQQRQTPHQLAQLMGVFKQLDAFRLHLKPLMVKHARAALRVETSVEHIDVYLSFVLEQLLADADAEVENNETTKAVDYWNEVALDLAAVFFERNYYLSSSGLLRPIKDEINNNNNMSNNDAQQRRLLDFARLVSLAARFAHTLLKLNEHESHHTAAASSSTQSDKKQWRRRRRRRRRQQQNSTTPTTTTDSLFVLARITDHDAAAGRLLYMHEKLLNFVVYVLAVATQGVHVVRGALQTESGGEQQQQRLALHKTLVGLETDVRRLADELFFLPSQTTTTTSAAAAAAQMRLVCLNCEWRSGEALNECVVERVLAMRCCDHDDAFQQLLEQQVCRALVESIVFGATAPTSISTNGKMKEEKTDLVQEEEEEGDEEEEGEEEEREDEDEVERALDCLMGKYGLSFLSARLLVSRVETVAAVASAANEDDKLAALTSRVRAYASRHRRHGGKSTRSYAKRMQRLVKSYVLSSTVGSGLLAALQRIIADADADDNQADEDVDDGQDDDTETRRRRSGDGIAAKRRRVDVHKVQQQQQRTKNAKRRTASLVFSLAADKQQHKSDVHHDDEDERMHTDATTRTYRQTSNVSIKYIYLRFAVVPGSQDRRYNRFSEHKTMVLTGTSKTPIYKISVLTCFKANLIKNKLGNSVHS